MDGTLTPGIDRPVRVALADDDCMFRASLRQLLSAPSSVTLDIYGVDRGGGFRVVYDGDMHETLQSLAGLDADICLLALEKSPLPDLRWLRQSRGERTDLRIILRSDTIERSELFEALILGVRGIVLKNATAEMVLTAIGCVMAGRYWMDQRLATGLMEIARHLVHSSPAASSGPASPLTRRESEIVRLLVDGCGNKEIAQALGMSADTVKHHLTRMFTKCGVSNRVELAIAAKERGLLRGVGAPAACHDR